MPSRLLSREGCRGGIDSVWSTVQRLTRRGPLRDAPEAARSHLAELILTSEGVT
jgi:hypothetical protein